MIKHKRKILRLNNYDYSQSGIYFITLCTFEKMEIFGNITNGTMVLNNFGKIVQEEWLKTPIVRSNILLDQFIVMPNHIHGIIVINNNVGATRWVARDPSKIIEQVAHNPSTGLKPNSIGSIIGQFKSISTKKINEIQGNKKFIWQRNYYDHIIRDDEDLNRVRQYILDNPNQWGKDENNLMDMEATQRVAPTEK